MKSHTPIFRLSLVRGSLFLCCLMFFAVSATAQSEGNAINEGIELKDPPNVTTKVVFNPNTGFYEIHEKIGDLDYRPVKYMTKEEYMRYDSDRALRNYWSSKSTGRSGTGESNGIIPSIHINNQLFDRIFGGNTIDVRLQGSVELIFGVRNNFRGDPMISKPQRSITRFVFEEKINANIVAKIGNKIEFSANYNTELTFGFENKLQLKYEGDEDDILQLIEAGNVNLPLNSSLIRGSQSLFGIKTKLKFGKTTVTAVVSQQESEAQTVQMEGGGQKMEFVLKADNYEENRHFFIAQYFYQTYDSAYSKLPQILSSININKMEVWITNIGPATQENRNILAFTDLGESNPYNDRIHGTYTPVPYPSNASNDLLTQLQPNIDQIRNINTISSFLNSSTLNMVSGRDYEKIENARKLQHNEYTYNPTLGFISLKTTLNSNQVLAVAFQYTVIGDPTVYQVGELSDGGIPSTQTLMVKLLRSTAVNPQLPIWKLMMKNVYSLNSYQVNREDFILNILFSGSSNGVPTGYLPEKDTAYGEKPLIEVLGFDRLDNHLARNPDGIFDFIDNAATNGGTIQSENGRIYFTVTEPFGSYLRKKINNNTIANKYCYDSLYTMTKTGAQQYPEKNKFIIEGYYKSTKSSEISLNGLNIPQGSVVVSAGGRQLVENVDYIVDYTLGTVRIINEGLLNSGTPISVSSENKAAGGLMQKRTFLGVHVDHQVNKDLVFGATFLNMFERPLTQKTNLGDEPVNNIMWGLNGDWQQESHMITKWLNVLPFYSTKMPSRVAIGGEFAHFIPGHSKSIGKSGTSYIDDFEAATTTIDLKSMPIYDWFLSSVPQHNPLFLEGDFGITLETGFNRAKIAWYMIDQTFYSTGRNVPNNVTKDELSKNSVRQVLQEEVFPYRQTPTGQPTNLPILNFAYYPQDIGPYNYDTEKTNFSSGVQSDGTLANPASRWAGIMRRIESSDFEQSNVEYIEFWMMDPFNGNTEHKGGDLIFHLGEISEDILRDSRKSFEHGLPTSELVLDVDTTIWGRVPRKQALVNSFSNDPNAREFQDVGYDGLRDVDERTFFADNYLNKLSALFGGGSNAYQSAYNDPSHDNYHYFRSEEYDNSPEYASILEKYKNYNGPDGNSSTASPDGYMIQSTITPNMEDIDGDNTLSEAERYYEYQVSLRPQDMATTGENFITDIYKATGIRLENGNMGSVNWYQFKVPISSPTKVIGNIHDFRSIRFMRIVFRGFDEEVVCRFAKLQLVRADWRRYQYDLLAPGEYIPVDDEAATKLAIATVNLEENGNRYPVPYILPPGIDRETNYASMQQIQRNEQAMSLKITDLIDGDARAVYKNTNFDFTQYEFLKMFVHAEDVDPSNPNNYGDMSIFIRMGADITSNYYEYEIPIAFTPWGISRSDEYGIWPEENNFNIDLEKLVQYKADRNVDIISGGGSVLTIPYIVQEGNAKITILGSPSISEVKCILIGIRNLKDDKRSRSAEIWVNELRLTGFINKQGWAATGRVRIDLADFGNIQFTALHTSAGFGSIEEKTNDRSRDNVTLLDFGTNLELGKMTPEKWGFHLPLHFDYSNNRAVPLYSPFDPDVKYRDVVRALNNEDHKNNYKESSIDVVSRTNINFMNIRKERTNLQKNPHFWDIENFDASYAYSYMHAYNFDVQFDTQLRHLVGLGYNYSLRPKEVAPFKNISWLKSPWLKLIRDFNFYYLPNNLAFRTTLQREYQERKLREKSVMGADLKLPTTYYKNYTWDRDYSLRWDLTRGLKLQYHALANTFMQEKYGSKGDDKYGSRDEKRDQIRKELFNGGTYNNYNQRTTLTYTVPLDKIPLTDWLSATATYDGSYNWIGNSWALRQDSLGNTIENSANISLNARVNFTTLYNKVGYLKKINSARPQVRTANPPSSKPGKDGDTAADSTAKKQSGPSAGKQIADGFLKVLMMLKDISGSYTQMKGTMVPGFMPEPDFFGVNHGAPGWGFVFGWQDENFIKNAISNGWLTTNPTLNTPYALRHTQNIRVQGTVEPIRDLRIDVSMNHQYSETNSAFMRYVDSLGGFPTHPMSPTMVGSFNMSTILLKTTFKKTSDKDPFDSEPYNEMRDNRLIISNRLAQGNHNYNPDLDTTVYKNGYGPTSQDVLFYSFLAAYTGKDANTIKFQNPKNQWPLPNWRLSWKGLNNIKFIKDNFRSVALNHGYQATYAISGYQNNQLYDSDPVYKDPIARDQIGDYIPEFNFGQIVLSEQFVPFLGIDMTLKNSLMLRFEYKRGRTLALSFVNNQLTEQSNSDFNIGAGYRISKLPNIFKSGSKKDTELNLKLDIGMRTIKTILRRLDSNIDEMSQGNKTFTIAFNAEYRISKFITARLFFDRNQNIALNSLQYDTSVTNGGIGIRLNLAQ